jgi:intracellular sulfur oxidation DsrE/DsrF family protein
MIARLTVFSLLVLGCWLYATPAWSDPRTYLEVSPDGRDDLVALMSTLEGTLEEGLPMADPVVIILHGSEATSFTSQGYARNRMLVDRAARLSAYRLIDVRMCETWMRDNGVKREEIPAFVDTVPFAPEEIRKLKSEGYVAREDLNI